MSIDHIGNRIKSDHDLTLYRRFPNSPNVKTLPAGKPSPVITSYLSSGYYQLDGGETENLYVKKSDKTTVVPPDSEDESGFLSSWLSAAGDYVGNTSRWAGKQAGFIREGFTDSVKDVGFGLFKSAKTVERLLYAAAVVFLLYLISDWKK